MANNWRIERTGQGPNGETVQLLIFEGGKGRNKFRSWKILVNGDQIDYASTPADAEENFQRAVTTGKGRQA